MIEKRPSTCRLCSAYCPVVVTLDAGKVVKVEGNHDAPLYGGFICPKGRALPALHNNPDRLLTSMKRQPDGSYNYKGATEHDLALMRASVSAKVQVKAAGGVRDLDGLIKVRDLGGSRCGATATAAMMDEYRRREAAEKAGQGTAGSGGAIGSGGY